MKIKKKTVFEVDPYIAPEINNFIDNINSHSILKIFKDDSPLHIVFPEVLSKNIDNIVDNTKIPLSNIFFALKSTTSLSLIRKAADKGINAEVSTLNELQLAKEIGFNEIIAGGPKSLNYLKKAVDFNVIVSVDSLFELEELSKINKPIRLLLRISNPKSVGKNFTERVSRFGISRDELNSALETIKKNKSLNLVGFHSHHAGFDAEAKKGFSKYFLDLIEEIRLKNYAKPYIINLGGGFRSSLLKDGKQWLSFIKYIEESLTSGIEFKVWGNYSYGINLGNNNKIQGRKKAESYGIKANVIDEFNTILSTSFIDSLTLNDVMYETGIRVIFEPGFLISTTSGMSVFEIIGVKKSSCGANLVVVNGHMFNISSNTIEHLTDPLLLQYDINSKKYISEKVKNTLSLDKNYFEGYIVGSLCREDDFLMKRKIKFSNIPKKGDKLVFFNTGSYSMSYESSNPQRFSSPRYYSAQTNSSNKKMAKNYDEKKSKNKWMIESDC